MTVNETFLVVVPTYNERDNIESLVREILAQDARLRVLVIDDSSPDGTAEVVRRLMKDDERISLLVRPGKLGLGTATIAGLRECLRRGCAGAIVMDADFSHHPRYLPAMLRRYASGAQVVIGSRYVAGGGVSNWPLYRRAMSRAINLYAKLWLGLTVRDVSGAYRLYGASVLKELDLDRIWSRGYSFQEEVLFWLRRAGAKFGEVPILFEDRRFGQSKINTREAIVALIILTAIGLAQAVGTL